MNRETEKIEGIELGDLSHEIIYDSLSPGNKDLYDSMQTELDRRIDQFERKGIWYVVGGSLAVCGGLAIGKQLSGELINDHRSGLIGRYSPDLWMNLDKYKKP